MKSIFALSFLLLTGSAFGKTAPEISVGQVNGEFRSTVYKPDITQPSGYKTSSRKIQLNGVTTSIGVRTDLLSSLMLKTSVGTTSNFTEELLNSDLYLQVALQNVIYRFQPAGTPSGEHFYLSFGVSGNQLDTTEGYINSLGLLAGLGFGHFSEGLGFNLEVDQNESMQANDLDVGAGVVNKGNQLSFLRYTAAISYQL